MKYIHYILLTAGFLFISCEKEDSNARLARLLLLKNAATLKFKEVAGLLWPSAQKKNRILFRGPVFFVEAARFAKILLKLMLHEMENTTLSKNKEG